MNRATIAVRAALVLVASLLGPGQRGESGGGPGGETVEWSLRLGLPEQGEVATAVAEDAAGGALVLSEEGPRDLGALVSGPRRLPVFLSRLGPDGTLLRKESLGAMGTEHLAAARSGSAWIAGTFQGSLEIQGTRIAGGDDGDDSALIAQIDDAGKLLFARTLPRASAVAVGCDAASNALVAGDADASADLGSGQVTGGPVSYVMKLGASGAPLWVQTFPSAREGHVAAMAVDPEGNATVTMDTEEIDFGSGALRSAVPQGEPFIARLGPDGARRWIRPLAVSGAPLGWLHSVAAGRGGEAYVAGVFTGTVDLGGGPLVAGDTFSSYVAKLGADGALEWSTLLRADGSLQVRAVAVDDGGNVFVTGVFEGTLADGAEKIVARGSGDAFFLELDPLGQVVWVWSAISGRWNSGQAVTVGSRGDALFAGVVDQIDLETLQGTTDLWVTRVARFDGR